MRAISIAKFGEPGGMQVVDVAVPAPGPEELLVAVEAVGVGGVDAVIRRGTIGSLDLPAGFVPGSEVAGRVVAAGDRAYDSWVGRAVWAFTGVGGAYAEQAVARLDHVIPLPEGLSPVDAVTAVARGELRPVVHDVLPLEEAAEAHRRMDAGEVFGRIVLTVK